MKTLDRKIQNGIPYLLGADGNYYPQIFGDPDGKPLGKYGTLMQSYLMEEQPQQMQELLMEGRLLNYLLQMQELNMEKYNQIVNRLRQQNPLPEGSGYLETVQYHKQIEAKADEIVIHELISK